MPTKAKSTPAPLSEDAIRDRAYLMWEADGRPEGMAEHYWMKAAAPDVSVKLKAKPKLKAAAAKVSAPAVKVKPAAKAPVKTATKKAAKKA